jgi:hypothetical protein
MTDESKSETTSNRPQESRPQSGGNPSTSRASGSSYGDPVRREFGDKTDEVSKKVNPSKVDDKSDKVESPRSGGEGDDSGEGHKDPRGEVKSTPSDTRSQGARPNVSNQSSQPTQKSPQTSAHGSSGSDCSTSSSQPDAKPARTQGGNPAV